MYCLVCDKEYSDSVKGKYCNVCYAILFKSKEATTTLATSSGALYLGKRTASRCILDLLIKKGLNKLVLPVEVNGHLEVHSHHPREPLWRLVELVDHTNFALWEEGWNLRIKVHPPIKDWRDRNPALELTGLSVEINEDPP